MKGNNLLLKVDEQRLGGILNGFLSGLNEEFFESVNIYFNMENTYCNPVISQKRFDIFIRGESVTERSLKKILKEFNIYYKDYTYSRNVITLILKDGLERCTPPLEEF